MYGCNLFLFILLCDKDYDDMKIDIMCKLGYKLKNDQLIEGKLQLHVNKRNNRIIKGNKLQIQMEAYRKVGWTFEHPYPASEPVL